MKKKSKFKTGDYSLSHVLYQKLGNDWYAFTEVSGECFASKVDAVHAKNQNEQQSDDVAPRKRRAA
ncbi:MAG: hypothetical protein ACXWQO_08100 [Bdellovibrionota bacterium]